MSKKYISTKVHMLPTKDNSEVVLHESGSLGYLPRLSLNTHWKFVEKDWANQHLYFTTDEEIKEGDWVILYYPKGYEIAQMEKGKSFKNSSFINNEIKLDGCKHQKIVASTDESLNLPQPSQAFIQKYCELGGIDEVDIELKSSDLDYFFGDLKVDSHNTITIHSIKDSWSREEVIELLSKLNHTLNIGSELTFEEWLKENL